MRCSCLMGFLIWIVLQAASGTAEDLASVTLADLRLAPEFAHHLTSVPRRPNLQLSPSRTWTDALADSRNVLGSPRFCLDGSRA